MQFFLLFIFSSTLLFAKDISIIANINFPILTLTKSDVKQIYLDKKRYIHGKKILPLTYKYDNYLRAVFEKKILKKSKHSLERYWLKAHYNGHRPPKVLQTKASMLTYIEKLDNAIGYTDENISTNKNIRVLLKVKLP